MKREPIYGFDILNQEAAEESAEYIRPYLSSTVVTDEGWWNVACNKIKIDGLCIELGVYGGESINYFSKYRQDKIWYGFDSFNGFQEDWKGGYYSQGCLSLNGKMPLVNSNVRLIKGFFKDTLPPFLEKTDKNISFIHVDCDTYESTLESLNILKTRLIINSLILFDEYTSFPGWKEGEFKAWKEFVQTNKIKYKYEMFGPRQALVRITEI